MTHAPPSVCVARGGRLLPAAALLALLAAPISWRSAMAAEGSGPETEDHTVTLVLAEGTVDLNHSVGGMIFLAVHIESPACEKKEENCDVKFTFQLLNRMDEGGVAKVMIHLVDADGKILQSRSGETEVEEGEDERLKVKMEVPREKWVRIKRCRLELGAEED